MTPGTISVCEKDKQPDYYDLNKHLIKYQIQGLFKNFPGLLMKQISEELEFLFLFKIYKSKYLQ